MKTYYEQDGITIYHGDCNEVLPLLESTDLVFTNPPYGIQFISNRRFVRYEDIRNDDSLPIGLISKAINKAHRAAYIFCRWNNLYDMPYPRSVLVWIKDNWSMGDLKHEHGRQWEAICFYPKDGHEFVKRIPDVLMVNRPKNGFHPTQKPVGLITKILAANVGNSVLDPCMGSGSILVAAKSLGCKAIGIEIEERYCEIAANRLSQEVFKFV